MKVLALDFDGVIGDTIWDNFFTAYNVYLKFNPDTRLFGGKQLTFDNFNSVKQENHTILEKFSTLRAFASAGKHQLVCFYIIDRKEEIKNQLEFDVYCSNFSETALNSFQTEFYLERKRLQSLDLEKWYELSPPFIEVIPNIKKLLDGGALIVSSKDKDSVMRLLERYHLKIDEDKVFDKEFGLDKLDILNSLVEKMKIKKEEMIFVDDMLKHLLRVKNGGFKCFMAAWGYSTKEQRKDAENLGITLLTKENFYEVISKELSD
jgi:phosphoglycolate phosphatase-like HAD superfamily hydrolase